MAASSSASVSDHKEGVIKVVLIDTRYVVTEPESFKSVVQRLTGKDSCVSWIEEKSFTGGGERKRKRQSASVGVDHVVNGDYTTTSSGAEKVAGSGEWRLSKGMSSVGILW